MSPVNILPAMDPTLGSSLADADPEVFASISAELARQESTLEMIASENFAPLAVMQAQGSVMTNKYAEGYPGRRYYGGCEYVDVDRAAGDRPAEGALRRRLRQRPATLRRPGERRGHGGPRSARRHDPRPRARPRRPPHPRHAAQLLRSALPASWPTASGKTITSSTWTRWRDGPEHRPKMIIAGWSAYPRQLDFARVPPDRRRGRRLADGGHGALRGAGRRWLASVAASRTPMS